MSNTAAIGELAIGTAGIGDDVLYREATSYTTPTTSRSIRTTDLGVTTATDVTPTTSTAARTIALLTTATSHAATAKSAAARSTVDYGPRTATSHTTPIRTFTYNERTSLELIDYTVTWDDDAAVWYTPWVSESKILGTEDTFVVRGNIIEGAKEPCALVTIQYDATGNGVPDAESAPVQISRGELAHEVPDIPVSTEGQYRIQIFEYSGYNSLYSLDIGIVH